MSKAKSKKWFGFDKGWKEDPSDGEWLDDEIYDGYEKPTKKPKLK